MLILNSWNKFVLKLKFLLLKMLSVGLLAIYTNSLKAATSPNHPENRAHGQYGNRPLLVPQPPTINAKSYILIDVNSGKIIAEKNSEQKLPPASLTKMMTLYLISDALNKQQLQLDDSVRISHNAWNTYGSRMFVKEGERVKITDLLKGIIVQSGNDACIAMAEHLNGGEETFVIKMNEEALALGMHNSHFTDSTGLPNKKLYSTAKDLAILGQALIQNFPQYYHWYKEKWFTYNNIRQPNRNRLLWRNLQVDGIKTGHTNDAGFCLVSSAKRQNMRLLAVIMGSPTEALRNDDSERLLNYGFRFFKTHKIYSEGEEIKKLRIYKGENALLPVGVEKNYFITIPAGQYERVKINTKFTANLQAPIIKGTKIGELTIQFDRDIIDSQPLYALTSVQKGNFLTRAKDTVCLFFQRWSKS